MNSKPLSANERKRIDDAVRARNHSNYMMVALGWVPNAAALKGLQPAVDRVLTDSEKQNIAAAQANRDRKTAKRMAVAARLAAKGV